MRTLLQHAALAVRMLRRRPGLAIARLLTITLIITAVSAVLAVANVTFLRPLPFPQSDRLVRVVLQPHNSNDLSNAFPLYPFVYRHLADDARSLISVEGIWFADRPLGGDGEPDSIAAGRVSQGFFHTLGADPVIGRAFTDDEMRDEAHVVVISDGLWQRRYGRDRSIVGRTIQIDRQPFTVIGITPAGFEPLFTSTELWTPLRIVRGGPVQAFTAVQTFGVIRPGVSTDDAAAEFASLFARMRPEASTLLGVDEIRLASVREAQYGSQRNAVLMLLGAVLALALIAIANLANLTLADIAGRRRDFAVRAALGGSRLDLAAPEIAQSLLLAALGAAAGLALAVWLVPQILALDPSGAFGARAASIDWRVATGSILMSALVMLAAVVVPALRVRGMAEATSAGGQRSIGGPKSTRTRAVLVGAQTALAIVLLSSGALIVKTLADSSHINLGFAPEGLLTAQLRLPPTVYPEDADRASFIERVIDGIQHQPGVESAASTLHTFSANGPFVTLVKVEGHPQPGDEGINVQYRRISPGYFSTMKIRLLKGRAFDRHDWVDSQPVAIVSRSFAERYWPNGDAVGRRIKRGATANNWSDIVGVVDDVRDVGVSVPAADTVYSPYFQASNPVAPVAIVVRTAGDPSSHIADVKRAVWALDPAEPLSNVVTMNSFLRLTLGPQRFRAVLVTICAAFGLVLATIGTYGVTSRSVAERRREVGIRLALGGATRDVWGRMAWGSSRAVAIGAGIGLLSSLAATQGLMKLFPELAGAGSSMGVIATIFLFGVGALAAIVAARSVTSIQPVTALRGE